MDVRFYFQGKTVKVQDQDGGEHTEVVLGNAYFLYAFAAKILKRVQLRQMIVLKKEQHMFLIFLWLLC